MNFDDYKGKVIFIGAGPGDPDLITVKGSEAIENADVIIYAGSLVNPAILERSKDGADIYDSAHMDLVDIIDVIKKAHDENKIIARVHTGDPSIYGAIAEQINQLKELDIGYTIIPGVSSLFGTAAALESQLTLPEVSQTIIITRPEGRTPKPSKESLDKLASHNATMCIFLGIHMIDDVVEQLLTEYDEKTPVAIVKKATWPDQEILRGNLSNIAQKVHDAGFTKTAMIVVGDVLDQQSGEQSKLYDPKFAHMYRDAK
ncbi:MAG: precorrin-4 C(11)-methyltransferase [Methanosphaera sp.]|nr:precorrin-4 C(11)-methyltransferase [Methanosphaera sp.]